MEINLKSSRAEISTPKEAAGSNVGLAFLPPILSSLLPSFSCRKPHIARKKHRDLPQPQGPGNSSNKDIEGPPSPVPMISLRN